LIQWVTEWRSDRRSPRPPDQIADRAASRASRVEFGGADPFPAEGGKPVIDPTAEQPQATVKTTASGVTVAPSAS
jgi:hypothetical protein